MPTENANQPTIDFLILADRAEAVNGKLYMMGGGWERIFVADFTQQQGVSLAAGILVPWNATNIDNRLSIKIETQDGNDVAALNLGFRAGRPSNLTQGETQRVVLAFQLALKLAGPGTYVVIAFVNDYEGKRVVFHAETLPQPPTAGMRPPV